MEPGLMAKSSVSTSLYLPAKSFWKTCFSRFFISGSGQYKYSYRPAARMPPRMGPTQYTYNKHQYKHFNQAAGQPVLMDVVLSLTLLLKLLTCPALHHRHVLLQYLQRQAFAIRRRYLWIWHWYGSFISQTYTTQPDTLLSANSSLELFGWVQKFRGKVILHLVCCQLTIHLDENL